MYCREIVFREAGIKHNYFTHHNRLDRTYFKRQIKVSGLKALKTQRSLICVLKCFYFDYLIQDLQWILCHSHFLILKQSAPNESQLATGVRLINARFI